MKVSVDWLNEFVDIDIEISELAKRLTGQGISVEGIEQIGSDFVLDLEITPNRPDLLSVFGIAREIKAMLQKNIKKNPFDIAADVKNNGSPISIEIEDSTDCPRYAGCSIDNIKVGPSPDWLKQRLEVMGIRSLNNIVDISNYVLLETGHPLHAFDAEFIKGKKILVRRAKNNESIITLDGIERKLDKEILVIADSEKPIALAGIMGGEESEIKKNTKNIFIESAYFNSTLIRRGARKLNLSTESSYRFERKADIYALIPALLRAREMIIKLSSGKMKGGLTDIYKKQKTATKKVILSTEWLNRFLGSNLSRDEIVQPLTLLDFSVKGDSRIEVDVPSFRRDIEIKEDIAEEVIRMVGFDRIPMHSTIVFEKIGTLPQSNRKIDKIKKYFISRGYDEVVNISFISIDDIKPFKMGIEPIMIQNPITSNLTHMRTNLIVGLLKTVKRNINIGNRNIRVFELGNIFIQNTPGGKPTEPLKIAGTVTGKVKKQDWRGENRTFDYYDLKGDIEGLFDLINIRDRRFEEVDEDFTLLEEASNIYIEKEKIGFIGSLSTEIRNFYDISRAIFLFEMELSPILNRISFDYKFKDLPKYPAVLRDLCLLTPNNVTHQQIEDIMQKSGEGLVEKIELFDTYQTNKSSHRLRSLTYSLTFRSDNRTLKDEEVNSTMDVILKNLSLKKDVKLRGKE